MPSGEARRRWLRTHRRDLATGFSALLLAAALLGRAGGLAVPWSNALFAASIVVGGASMARAGWRNLLATRGPDMNVLMSIAAAGAMIVGEFAEGAVTVLLFSIGELLEGYSLDRARHAIRSLMELAPEQATLRRDNVEAVVPVGALRIGDVVVVRPSERLPMDGRIIEGRSLIDQAPITGESLPVERAAGDEVYAGTINGSGALLVEVTRLAGDNTLARIMRLVEQAQTQRAPTQRWVDRFARVYTPVVIGLAGLVALVPPLMGFGALSEWFYRALVMLVIACPCALVISTPVTIVSALARAARSGVLIKGGRYLEQLAGLRAIAFDKTGTLTEGRPQVVRSGCEQHPTSERACAECADLVAMASAIERRSEHALARAVTRHAEAAGLHERYAPGEAVTALTGLGIEGIVAGHNVSVGSTALAARNGGGESALYRLAREEERQGRTVLVIDDACCDRRCYLSVADRLRPEVPETIRALHGAGIQHTIMLTGDNAYTAAEIARAAGVEEVRAGLLPEDKLAVVGALQARYGAVAMVGDGVNDAPAMARASIGIAMGAAGTDAALETADVALMSDDLTRLPYLLRLSRAALRVVRGNIVFALGLKMLFLALAAGGIATLWMAVLADTGASLLVTLNGMRLLAYRERHPDQSRVSRAKKE